MIKVAVVHTHRTYKVIRKKKKVLFRSARNDLFIQSTRGCCYVPHALLLPAVLCYYPTHAAVYIHLEAARSAHPTSVQYSTAVLLPIPSFDYQQ